MLDALAVGQVTFQLFSKVECVAAALIVNASVFVVLSRTVHSYFIPTLVILTVLVLAQAIWLLPKLDARLLMRLSGIDVPEAYLHQTYIVIELAKVIALSVLPWLLTKGEGMEKITCRVA